MEQKVDTLEQKAQAVAGIIDGLAGPLAKLEANNVQEVQKEILEQLYAIRQSLFEDYQKSQKNAGASDGTIKMVPENSNAEVEALKRENARLKYRVKHMERGMMKLIENEEAKKLTQEKNKLEYRIKFLLQNSKDYEQINYKKVRGEVVK
mmetsp:Transcript_56831/g.65110  ORF Transcript_56831/g.65110 Transcript_56831/m.65110 type:complete len:150 (+) Transcript_56831:19-468(+)|eukprot:CAMPEP_0176425294 /NCGR_PEP_ID=MMETSP0127-20121128/11312_1 /TAXON_ID=938130 /ORGANISM="Platyophrya macrostoma, Strain WH" /LENGTH=149 /DNA_ID=CAMNT_0017806445 /DNA_START=19 /DNA_END=468 /DNA_ORIENTATION=-